MESRPTRQAREPAADADAVFDAEDSEGHADMFSRPSEQKDPVLRGANPYGDLQRRVSGVHSPT